MLVRAAITHQRLKDLGWHWVGLRQPCPGFQSWPDDPEWSAGTSGAAVSRDRGSRVDQTTQNRALGHLEPLSAVSGVPGLSRRPSMERSDIWSRCQSCPGFQGWPDDTEWSARTSGAAVWPAAHGPVSYNWNTGRSKQEVRIDW